MIGMSTAHQPKAAPVSAPGSAIPQTPPTPQTPQTPKRPQAPQTVRDAAEPFPYVGPEDLREVIHAALCRVVDPEIAMNIVDVGLIYGVEVVDDVVQVRLTMTSAACPVTDLIIDDVGTELDKVVPAHMAMTAELVWEPPWTPERMSERARAFMGW